MKLSNLNLKEKRIFLRADLNIPLENGKITQDFKLHSIIPTIKYIQKNGGKVILATHIGRPDAQSETNYFDKKLSTDILLPWFEEQGFKIRLERDLMKSITSSSKDFDEILLLENLRFFNGEKSEQMQEQDKLAKLLKATADIYINDAFALLHRNDTSVTRLPQLFEPENRAFGLLVEKEIKELNKLKNEPEQPFVLVLGGSKIKTKIPLLESFLHKDPKNRPTSILIGGALSYTFLQAQGLEVGKSLVEEDYLEFAENFLKKAKEKNINIVLPADHLTLEDIDIKELLSEPNQEFKTNVYRNDNIPKTGTCIDIGPETIKLFSTQIEKAKTIFTNGTMGIYTIPEFAKGSQEILTAITNSNVYSVAGGGDAVAAIHKFNLQDRFSFLSTGGGATLAFLGTEKPAELFNTLNCLC
jgi:3-phosphoglycerate kinase